MSPRIWFITGASSGMGRSMTEYVLSKGDIAVATLREPSVLSNLTAKYSKDKLLVLKLDVTQLQDILNAFARAKEVFGRIDVVYNNAGYAALGELEGTPLDVARQVFEVNFWGAINVARESVRFFREENKPSGGYLLNVSSLASLVGPPGLGFYGSAKSALNSAIDTLSREINSAWNIKIVIIQLGGFQTRCLKEGSLVITPVHLAYDDPAVSSYHTRRFFGSDPKVPGDTNKATAQIYKLAELESPALYIPLGKDALKTALDVSKTYADAVEGYGSWSDDLKYDWAG